MAMTRTARDAPLYAEPTLTLDQAAADLRALVEGERALATRTRNNLLAQGDIALAAVPSGALGALAVLAKLAGLDAQTLQHRWEVASYWPVSERGDRPWVVLETLVTVKDPQENARLRALFDAPNPDHPQGKWTRAAVRRVRGQIVGHTGTAADVADLPLAEKVAAVARLVADPAVRDAVAVPGSEAGLAINRLSAERNAKLDEAFQARRIEVDTYLLENSPTHEGLEAAAAVNDLLGLANAFARGVGHALERIRALHGDGPLAQNLFLRDANARARGAVDQIDALLATGRPGGDIDRFLLTVLTESKEDRP